MPFSSPFRLNRLAVVGFVAAITMIAGPGVAQTTSVPEGEAPQSGSPDARHRGLSADLMYRLLVGDVALQRGEPALAARAYYEAARESREPALARRATEVALAVRQRGLAIESARLWSELDPA